MQRATQSDEVIIRLLVHQRDAAASVFRRNDQPQATALQHPFRRAAPFEIVLIVRISGVIRRQKQHRSGAAFAARVNRELAVEQAVGRQATPGHCPAPRPERVEI